MFTLHLLLLRAFASLCVSAVRLVFWWLHPLGLLCTRKWGATKPVRSFCILSLGLFNPPSLTLPS